MPFIGEQSFARTRRSRQAEVAAHRLGSTGLCAGGGPPGRRADNDDVPRRAPRGTGTEAGATRRAGWPRRSARIELDTTRTPVPITGGTTSEFGWRELYLRVAGA
jgi:hypothetical protein